MAKPCYYVWNGYTVYLHYEVLFMRVAVVGSRSLTSIDLSPYVPAEATVIVSGGARGVDACARAYAQAHGLALMEFLPDYPRYGRSAPLRRNRDIVAHADLLIAVWDGVSHGTAATIAFARELGVPVRVVQVPVL